jgi:E3 ubiquitin-protein ligase BRE1
MRQMQEYKREKSSLESRLNQMSKAATFHNDHLRVIDSWFKQVGSPFSLSLVKLAGI